MARVLVAIQALILCAGAAAQDGPEAAPEPANHPPVGEWRSIFDGKTLDGWKETDYFGKGDISIEDGMLVLGTGLMTGVNYTKPFPRSNYELRFEAMRIKGSDFFTGVVFPVKDSHCAWTVGGWGGYVVGLSNVDWLDAAENDTGVMWNLENNRWYSMYLRVTDDRVQAWIDDELAIDLALEGRLINMRDDQMTLGEPFGLATYSTIGGIRNIEYRLLGPSEWGDTTPPK